MKLQEVRTIAKRYSIKSAGLSKAELIRNIQLHEGNSDCFAHADNSACVQDDCLWREDCLVLS